MTCEDEYANNSVGPKASGTDEGGLGTYSEGVPSTLRLRAVFYAYGQSPQGVGLFGST